MESRRHVDFMTDAAHLLQDSAPETSAYLMRRRNELMFQAQGLVLSDVQRQHVCNACGHIMVPGQQSTLKLETERTKRRGKKSRQQQPSTDKDGASKKGRSAVTKTLVCGHCDAATRIPIPIPIPPRARARPRMVVAARASHKAGDAALAAESTAASAAAAAAAAATKKSGNATSKQRTKSRKGGLQALLNKSQATSSESRALSLADFLKK